MARIFLTATCVLTLGACTELRQRLVDWFEADYVAEAAPADKPATLQLQPAATGFSQITDIQFGPGAVSDMVVLQKSGEAFAVNLQTGAKRQLAKFDVLTTSEQGLLGLAFHPHFAQNGRVFLNLVRRGKAGGESVVLEAAAERDPSGQLLAFTAVRDIYAVAQPYQNHNGGGLAFGPDGYLYIGWGDGGWMDDPHGHGQNLGTALGAMLRIDVDRQTEGRAYAVPADNPFVGRAGALSEIWAYGLRNPWRYSFAPDGRLIAADVGQNQWEEINVVVAAGNYGWNKREGRHCFPPDKNEACDKTGLIDPIWDYDRSQGQSITGGYVYSGNAIPSLRGRYVFGDFVSGRIWSLALPLGVQAASDVTLLGKWPILISTFGWNGQDLFVADFGQGVVFKLQP